MAKATVNRPASHDAASDQPTADGQRDPVEQITAHLGPDGALTPEG